VLTAGNPAALEGSFWIDLYAGTGAVGIEALSRGAARVCFVESSAAAVKAIYENLHSLQITSGFEIIHADVLKALPRLDAGSPPSDYVFLDPPYCLQQAYADTLDLLAKSPLLKRTSIVMAEHQKKFDLEDRFDSLMRYRMLGRGDAALSFYRPA
jgi:16S rRNA (guanine(966)-N(2))-methyltransferase RsmD